ncbi:CDP-glycerol glycerophosphotransferase family protein [Pediococcus pentosaceus]|uniref:CDP-glycerol glycerophosphotransferase family protein n=1 Tax=Pediococcus pentosaceus TaxID=1255 RepID=UPI002FBD9EA7
MKEKIIEAIKKNNFIGWLYVQFLTCFYQILDFFLVPKPKQIIFTSFSGRQFSDSPRIIFEALKKDNKFSDFKFIWAFRNPSAFPEIDDSMKVDINSFDYLVTLLKSKYWISNDSIERLTPINSKKHIYINTWHGIPMKHLGPDEKNLEFIVKKLV